MSSSLVPRSCDAEEHDLVEAEGFIEDIRPCSERDAQLFAGAFGSDRPELPAVGFAEQ